MKISLQASLCCALMLFCVSVAPAQNLLVNGDFETGDLTGWTAFGDTSAGAPGVGANDGSFAALLFSPGGANVAGIFQTLNANPGDEFNLSGVMLTEADLPAGDTFGLLKIVFTDSDGNDLEPASVSIGQAGPAANPGVESLPFLNSSSAANAWQFSEAQGVAPVGTATVSFFALNVDFAGGENQMWYDSLQATKIPEPAGIGVLGIVALGMVARRRRK